VCLNAHFYDTMAGVLTAHRHGRSVPLSQRRPQPAALGYQVERSRNTVTMVQLSYIRPLARARRVTDTDGEF
jgi:hypothetical protein